MNGHLVMLHGTDYSFPLAFHATWEEVHAFRRLVRANPKQALEDVAIDTTPWPPGEFLSVSIVTFEGGRPVEEETYDFD